MSHQNINILLIPMGQISSAKIESKQMQMQKRDDKQNLQLVM